MSTRKKPTTTTEATATASATATTTATPCRSWSFLSLADWQSSQPRADWVRGLLAEPVFREWLGMLHREATTTTSVPAEEAARAYWQMEGRKEVLRWIEESAVAAGIVVDVPITYGVEDSDLT